MTAARDRIAGIDIGSRTTKIVVLDDPEPTHAIADSGPEPLRTAEAMVAQYAPDLVWATGYGRHLAHSSFANGVVTEIKATAAGTRALHPCCRTIIDVGGQDSKVIALDEHGRAIHFEMNDRCAAGTGKFLEVMAERLGFDLDTFGRRAGEATEAVPVNSTCTVFAESEVVSLIARGERSERIARGLHVSIAERIVAMVLRAGGPRAEVVFCGGVAHDPCLRALLADRLGVEITVPPHPQIVAALGAALIAREKVGGVTIRADHGRSELGRDNSDES
jgi:predicted CoA-substrate-specific enzyme activase